jgi:hypothetical protein
LDGPPASEKPADEKAGLPTTPTPSPPKSGLQGFEDFKDTKFTQIPLEGKYKTDFLKLYSDTLLMLSGMPGHGKTVYTLEFAQYLAAHGLKVLYLAKEEFGRSTLAEKITLFNIGHANLRVVRDFEMLKRKGGNIDDFDVIFFDSINAMKMKIADFEKFVEDHPGKMLVLILQSTKDGDFKGGQEWLHFVDVAGKIVDRKLILEKNRLDPDFKEKAEDLEIASMVKEKTKQNIINEKVKRQLAPEVKPEPAKVEFQNV